MNKVTLSIDGKSYEVSGATCGHLEEIHRDFIEELKDLNASTPRSGALDGPLQGLTAAAQRRYRQRIRDHVLGSIDNGGVIEVLS